MDGMSPAATSAMNNAYGQGGTSRGPSGAGRFWEMMQRFGPAAARRTRPETRDPYAGGGGPSGMADAYLQNRGGGGGLKSMLLQALMGGG